MKTDSKFPAALCYTGMAASIGVALAFFVLSVYYRPVFEQYFSFAGNCAVSFALWGAAAFFLLMLHSRRKVAVGLALLAIAVGLVASPYIAKKMNSPYYWRHVFPDSKLIFACKTDKPYVAVTFDGGPLEGRTAELLDVLKAHGAHATFFLIGKHLAGNEDIVRRMAGEGHAIGNHSWNHIPLNDLTEQQLRNEIVQTNQAVSAIIGEDVVLVRLPGGTLSPSQCKTITQSYGMTICVWNAMVPACARFTGKQETDAGGEQSGCGAIVLIHDCEITAEELDALLTSLEQKGLKCVSIPELLSVAEGVE